MHFRYWFPLFLSLTALGGERPQKEFPLWQGKAPGQQGDTARDIPTLTPYWSPNPTGAAMVICPGGGYGGLAGHEGKGYADWLVKQGVDLSLIHISEPTRPY